MIGQTISHYKILEKLGEGGMGVVYKAEDTKLKRTVALKFFSPQVVGTEEDKTRFIHEAQAAAVLNHSNICTVYEIDEWEGQSFIAMECIEGLSLKAKIESGPLKCETAIGIVMQIAEGLQRAHERDIVHRDIKAANIMITDDGQAKIMDFGLAKSKGCTQFTKEGTTLGTIAYMSPEQTRGEEVDHRTDIWSLGVVLYEMVTGQQPFKGDYEQAVVFLILNEEPDPMTALRTGVPMELERITGKAMAKNPNERYQNIADILVDLRAVHRSVSTGTPDTRVAAVAPDRTKVHLHSLGQWVGGTLLVILILFQVVGQLTGKKEVDAAESIAVIPFQNIRGDEAYDWLSRDLCELLTYRLSESTAIRVIDRLQLLRTLEDVEDEPARASVEVLTRQVSRELEATFSLVGSYTIYEGVDSIRVTARLVDAKTLAVTPLVYEMYPLSGLTTMQADVVGRIIDGVEKRRTPVESQ